MRWAWSGWVEPEQVQTEWVGGAWAGMVAVGGACVGVIRVGRAPQVPLFLFFF